MASRRQRIRVLHIVPSLNYGGMERLIDELLKAMIGSSIENHVLTTEYQGRFAQEMAAHATLHESPPLERWSMVHPGRLADAIRAIAPDVVHTHSGMWYKASLAARLAGVPFVVYTEHGRAKPDPWLSRTLDRRASRRTDVVIAVSEALAGVLRETVVADPSRVHVIANGVDPNGFVRVEHDMRLRNALGIGPETPILGSIGRLERVKGYDIMLEAYTTFRSEWHGPSMPVLVLAGDGSERAVLEQLARERGIDAGVHFLGWRDDIQAQHSAFTVFTMSSRSEGTSISLLEAMSARLCPVVTNVGGNAAVLGPALAHRLVEGGNPAALAAAWKNALVDEAGRYHDGEAARRRVLEAFTIQEAANAYVDTYEQLMGGKPVVPVSATS